MESPPSSRGGIREQIVEVLRTIYDPEIPVDIYSLGLVYELDLDDTGRTCIRMTLTAPGCPVADYLVEEVRQKVSNVPGVTQAEVELVWEPPWNPDMMSETARLMLNL
jgi:FeS assembly SUF system protein